jgi:F-type H+-transporting ATPase subunit delta
MQSSVVARRYAAALFSAAKDQQQVEAVSADLTALVNTLAQSPEFARVFNHLQLTADEKLSMLQPVLGQLLESPLTSNLIALLFHKGRENQMLQIDQEYQSALRQERQEVMAEVTTVRALSAAETDQLSELVKRLTGCRQVTIKSRVTQEILGGVIVRVGDKVFDGSLVRRLDTLRRQLKQAQVNQAGVSS